MGLWFLSSTVAHYIVILAKLTTSGQTTILKFAWALNSMFFAGVDPEWRWSCRGYEVYNDLFAKIGFVTIGIAFITLLISPIIKKLMGNVH